MKNTKKVMQSIAIITLVVVVGFLLAACKSAPMRTMPSLSRDVVPGPDETEIVFQNFAGALNKADALLNVIMDGEIVTQISPNSSERIIVKNGPHSIYVIEVNKRGYNPTADFVANSQRIVFNIQKVFGVISLTDQNEK